MARNTPTMGLRVWDSVNDFFNHEELADNWDLLDVHNHTGGAKGLRIPAGGIEANAVTSVELANNSVGISELADGTVITDKLVDSAVTTPKLADNSVTGSKIANSVVSYAKLATDLKVEARRYVGAAGQVSFYLGRWAAFGGGFEAPHFWKDPWGTVHLGGLTTRVGAAPVPGDVIFVLPTGYTPQATQLFACAAGDGGGGSSGYCRVDVRTNGEVAWIGGPQGEQDYTSLSTIHFASA